MSVSIKINKKELDYVNGLNPKRCNVLFLEVGEIGALINASGIIKDSEKGDIPFEVDMELKSTCMEDVFLAGKNSGMNVYPSQTRLYNDDESLEKFIKEEVEEGISVFPRYGALVKFKNSGDDELDDGEYFLSVDWKPNELIEDDKKIEEILERAYIMCKLLEDKTFRECFTFDNLPEGGEVKRISIDSFRDGLKVSIIDNKNIVKSYNFDTFSNVLNFIVSKSVITLDFLEQMKKQWEKFTNLFPNKNKEIDK